MPRAEGRREAYGTVDELNAHLGLLSNAVQDVDGAAPSAIATQLLAIQSELFTVGAQLSTSPPVMGASAKAAAAPVMPVGTSEILQLERAIDALEEGLSALASFILPGGDTAAS